MSSMGKLLIFSGLFLIGLGLVVIFSDKIPWLGRLPGDLHIKKEGWSFHFPIVTCFLISIVLTLIFNLLGKR